MNKTRLCLIGGGHGLSTILKGLKVFKYLDIIVDVTNSGGSTGKLRSTFQCPAMGDIRLVLSTLGDDKLKEIMEYRIPKYKDCVGNVIIAGLIKLYSFDEAIDIAQSLMGLPAEHHVIPVSLDNFDIKGKYVEGKIAKTETDFVEEDRVEEVWLDPKPKANPEAIKAIKDADWVIIAPGSFYTSILANLLIPEISAELKKKKVIWIANLMQQVGETVGMDLQEHYDIIKKYTSIHTAIVNDAKPKETVLKEYYESFLMPLLHLGDVDTKVITSELVDYSNKEMVTHDYEKLTNIIKSIIK